MNSEIPIAEPPSKPAPKEPVLATIVPPAPSPWQFGLKAMMGLMAVCCLQFALMNYVGVFKGLMLGLALCGALLFAMLFTAVFVIGSRSPLMAKLDFVGIRLVVAITVLFLGTIIAGGGTAAWEFGRYYQVAFDMESDLGLRTREIQVYDANGMRSGLQVLVVLPGSVADQAGIRTKEVIYYDETTREFYQRLNDNRGKPVALNIAIGAESASLDTCPKRTVTITVPK